MEFFEAIAKRRSIRKFTATVVPQAVIEKALDAALIAPNSSNMQPWEFYWVRNPEKKAQLVEACLSQGAAQTAAELIVAVARIDTWRRNRDFILADFAKKGAIPKVVQEYYTKIVPLCYTSDPFGIIGTLKLIIFSLIGFFRPVPRTPNYRQDIFEVVTKTTALACENFMLAMAAQGYGSCPMEGFDACRVKKILGLGRKARVVMVLAAGEVDPQGIWGEQFRIERSLVVHKV